MNRNYWVTIVIALAIVIFLKIILGLTYVLFFGGFRTELYDLFYFQYSNLVIILFVLKIRKYRGNTKCRQLINANNIIYNYLIGVFVGGALVTLIVFIISFITKSFPEYVGIDNYLIYFFLVIGFAIQSFSEELLFRKYIFDILYERKSLIIACTVQSVLFTLVHLLNNGVSIISFTNLMLFGFFLGLIRFVFDSTVMISGFHFIWNTMMSLVFGVRVSGVFLPISLFSTTFYGATIFTGGMFGIEGSIITSCILMLLVIFTVLLLVYKSRIPVPTRRMECEIIRSFQPLSTYNTCGECSVDGALSEIIQNKEKPTS